MVISWSKRMRIELANLKGNLALQILAMQFVPQRMEELLWTKVL